jgi:N4-gp56 family major capsid protein
MSDTIKELATGRTKTGNVDGSATSSTALQPAIWLRQINDAAQKKLMFMQAMYITEVGQGNSQVVVPYRSKYLGSSGVTYATATPNDGTNITATVLDNLDGITLTPAMQASRVTIGNYALKVNAINLINAAREELVYSISDKVDAYIATTLGDATSSNSSTTGMQTLYGGDATSDATLASGDVITTDLIAKGRRLLMDVNKQYRATVGAGGGYGAVSGTVTGNAWTSSPDEPFILFIGPAQEEALLKDSQFMNAAEYGSNQVILNGEIGQFPYLGIKVISTPNVERVASGGTGVDAEATTTSTAMTRCLLVKAGKCGAFAWGQKPQLKFYDNVPQVSQDIVLESAYQASVLHADAIVSIDVADA